MAQQPQEQQSDQRPSNSPENAFEEQDESGGSNWKSCLLGCGGVTLVTLLVLGGLGFYLYKTYYPKIRSYVSSKVISEVKKELDKARIHEEQKKKLKSKLDEVAKRFNKGDISVKQAGEIGEKIARGPFLPVGRIMYIEHRIVTRADKLSEEEKKQGHLTMDRLARAVKEKKIEQKTSRKQAFKDIFNPVMNEIKDQGNSGSDSEEMNMKTELKTNPSKEEIKTTLKRAEELVNELDIPRENWEMDFAGELDRIVDEVTSGENKQ